MSKIKTIKEMDVRNSFPNERWVRVREVRQEAVKLIKEKAGNFSTYDFMLFINLDEEDLK